MHIPVVSPARIGFLPGQLQRAYDLLQQWADSGEVPGSALGVGRRGAAVATRFFGLPEDALFSVASITKPIVAAAVLALVERGQLGLDDRIAEYVPEFAQAGKNAIRIRHLLTHTSGLPDQLPENVELRSRHAPLSAFVDGACRIAPLFTPGTRVRYQSMGFALLGEVLRRITGTALPEFLRAEFFEPLGLSDTSLGARPETEGRIARIALAPGLEATNWNWNTPYWRALAAPWGGLFTTPADLARYSRMMLDEGTLGKVRVLAAATVRAMTTNQLAPLPDVAEEDRRARPWGFGWRLPGAGHEPSYGDLLGPNAFGHGGASGTLCWLDPDADAFFVLLTTRPAGEEGRHLARISNVIASALA